MNQTVEVHGHTEIVAAEVCKQDEMESLENAIREVRRKIAANGINSNYLWGRLTELESGRNNLRRRQASNYLDAYLPPLRLFGIDKAEHPFTQWLKGAWRRLWNQPPRSNNQPLRAIALKGRGL